MMKQRALEIANYGDDMKGGLILIVIIPTGKELYIGNNLN